MFINGTVYLTRSSTGSPRSRVQLPAPQGELHDLERVRVQARKRPGLVDGIPQLGREVRQSLDFIVPGHDSHAVARWVIENAAFDRLYFLTGSCATALPKSRSKS